MHSPQESWQRSPPPRWRCWLPPFASAADLTVRIEGVRSADGDIRVALHRRADGVDFPDLRRKS